MSDAPPPVRYLGDDWSFPYGYVNPDGSAMDITGAVPIATLFARDHVAPVFHLEDASAATVVDARAGTVVFLVPASLTATLRADGNAEGYPTRIQIQLRDTMDRTTTYALDPVVAEDPRFAPLAAPA